MRTVITAARLFTPDSLIENPVIVLEDAHIAGVSGRDATQLPPGEHIDFPDCTLAPALLDVHIHGSGGHDVMEATSQSHSAVGAFLARRGVGAYLATTVTAPIDATLQSLGGISKLLRQPVNGARPLGVHIEGPFLSPHKKGAHPEHLLQTPSLALFDRLWQASEGSIRLMTIAPELPNAEEVIARATKLGVRVSLGHSDANAAEAKRGIAAGASSATHTFNAMRSFDHRDPGLLGQVLTDDQLFAEIICDGLHVDAAAVRLFWKAKGPERAILITDAMSATGMPDGNYKLGELDVRVENGKCLIGQDTLAGSTLTLDRAVRNFSSFAGATLQQSITLATRNPARMLGLDTETGAIATVARADIAVLDANGMVVENFLGGRRQLTS